MQSFDLDHDDITGKVGDTVKVTASNIKPTNATDGNITAKADDPTIAQVTPETNSLIADIKLLKAGSTKVTWKSNDGSATKTLNVTVTDPDADKSH